MALHLMYITKNTEVARVAESAGVDRIFVDMEYIGKADRQCGMDTVQSRHTVDDVKNVRAAISASELLVRVNPIHDKTDEYCSTEDEIDAVIDAGADIIMLPYFKTACEVQRFINAVNGRAKTMLLVETVSAVENIEEILAVEGIDEVFIGLNDLSLGYGKKFLFELLSDGTVERLCKIFAQAKIPYGFGGIASLGKGMLPSEYVIREHYRLGSTAAILSRSFCDVNRVLDINVIEKTFCKGVADIRNFEKECAKNAFDAEKNKNDIVKIVNKITESM